MSSQPGTQPIITGVPTSLDVPGTSAIAAAPALQADWLVSIAAVSNDPGYTSGNLWGMYGDATSPADAYGSQAGEAWAAGRTGTTTTVVGVVDTGIDYTHPDLYLNIWLNQGEIPTALRTQLRDVDADGLITFRDLNNSANASWVTDINHNGYIDAGDLLHDTRWDDSIDEDSDGYTDDLIGWDFANNDNDPFDDNGHGTHVSGTIGAIGGNGTGVVGVNWTVQIAAMKFLDSTGSGYTSEAAQAINYFTTAAAAAPAVENFVATNNSWGGGGASQDVLSAVARAAQQDILFIAAAGNQSSNNDSTANYPSNYSTTAIVGYDNVVAVASLTSTGGLSSFSDYGATTVDLAAPGSSIYSTLPGNSYGTLSGTSMATPHVTGAAALYASANPTATAAEIKAALLASTAATSSVAGKAVTGGRLDIGAMMQVTPTEPSPTGADAILGYAGTKATLAVNSSQASIIDVAGDQDWFRLSLNSGCRYDFAMNAATGSSLDTYLRLLSANNVELAVNDDSVGTNSRISFTATTSGTYYASAQGCGSNTGGYVLSLTLVSDAIAGSAGTTAVLTAGSSQASVIDVAGDQDWFRLSLVSGYRYDFAMDAATGSGLNTYLRLLDGSGAQLAFNDDSVGTNSRLTFIAGTTGTYYLSAQGAGSSTGAYTLAMTQTADTIAGGADTTAVLAAGAPQASAIDMAGDQDWFHLNLVAGYRYDFAMDAATGSGLNTYLRLLDGSGAQLAFNDDAVGTNSRLSFTVTTTGTYYLSAQGAGSSTGAYTLAMTQSLLNPPVTGTVGNDTLNGGSGDDTVSGLDGNDLLRGLAGNDSIDGGGGNDLIYGGDGHDTVQGGDGGDQIFAGPGLDSVMGGAGNDALYGEDDADTIIGGDGDDYLGGGAGNDSLDGGTGNDTAECGTGNDSADGGTGDDLVFGQDGNDTLLGGDGADRLFAGTGADSVDGGSGNDMLWGEDGADTLLGGDGGDYLGGGAGDDLLDSGDGNDIVEGGAGFDTLIGGQGDDLLMAGADDDRLTAGAGGWDRLFGGDGNDTIAGFASGTNLYGDAGNDLLVTRSTGGSGSWASGGDGADTFRYEMALQATPALAAAHLLTDGSIDWAAVAADPAAGTGAWLLGLGQSWIFDYSRAAGDRIQVSGIGTSVLSLGAWTMADGRTNTTVTIGATLGGKAPVAVGQIIVLGDALTAADIALDGAVHGAQVGLQAVDGFNPYALAWTHQANWAFA